MKTTLHILSLYCTVAFVSLILINELAVAADANFACGGIVEAEVWEAWDGNFRDYLRQSQLEARLLKQGDVYALYDIQTYTHNIEGLDCTPVQFTETVDDVRIHHKFADAFRNAGFCVLGLTLLQNMDQIRIESLRPPRQITNI